jgi:hypothetical protein
MWKTIDKQRPTHPHVHTKVHKLNFKRFASLDAKLFNNEWNVEAETKKKKHFLWKEAGGDCFIRQKCVVVSVKSAYMKNDSLTMMHIDRAFFFWGA